MSSHETAIESLCSELVDLSLEKSNKNIDKVMDTLLNFKPIVQVESNVKFIETR